MAVRINGVCVSDNFSQSALLECDKEVRRGTSPVKTYNVKDANVPEHIKECWKRCKE